MHFAFRLRRCTQKREKVRCTLTRKQKVKSTPRPEMKTRILFSIIYLFTGRWPLCGYVVGDIFFASSYFRRETATDVIDWINGSRIATTFTGFHLYKRASGNVQLPVYFHVFPKGLIYLYVILFSFA